ncbi:MAG: peptidase M50, partial [Myxococcales bacterium]|nr:peptidase M50 [Myxococcales bacterium]
MRQRSADWYRVASLRPALRSHVRSVRQPTRGQDWYVLEDTLSGNHHRYPKEAHGVISRFDGRLTLDEIFELAAAELGDDVPAQDLIIDLLARLDSAELLHREESHESSELLERLRTQRVKRRKERTNPLAIRVPLVDPDRWLSRLLPIANVLFRPLPLALAIAAVFLAAGAALVNWHELTHNSSERILAAENLPALVVAYLLVKLVHELGHGLVTRYWGGAVHEAGVMLLALMPMPYVDASASAVFPSRRKRIAVAGAGIAVELLISSLALFAWLLLDPGWFRTLAWQLVWLGAASTLLFNGNPLLRFDGYYILADWIGIPNLGQRASQYWAYLSKRWILRQAECQSPVDSGREEAWLAAYGFLSFFYRLSVMAAIAVLVGEVWFTAGVVLVAYMAIHQLGLPIVRIVRHVATSPELIHRRGRAAASALAVGGGILGIVCLFPVPNFTRAEGVVWAPEGREIRVRTDGFVRFFQRLDGSPVEPFETVIETEDPLLNARLAVARAELRVLQAERAAAVQADPGRVRQIDDEIGAARKRLDRV